MKIINFTFFHGKIISWKWCAIESEMVNDYSIQQVNHAVWVSVGAKRTNKVKLWKRMKKKKSSQWNENDSIWSRGWFKRNFFFLFFFASNKLRKRNEVNSRQLHVCQLKHIYNWWRRKRLNDSTLFCSTQTKLIVIIHLNIERKCYNESHNIQCFNAHTYVHIVQAIQNSLLSTHTHTVYSGFCHCIGSFIVRSKRLSFAHPSTVHLGFFEKRKSSVWRRRTGSKTKYNEIKFYFIETVSPPPQMDCNFIRHKNKLRFRLLFLLSVRSVEISNNTGYVACSFGGIDKIEYRVFILKHWIEILWRKLTMS